MKWSQLKVRCKTADLDKVVAVMSMLDNGLMIEDYSDIDETSTIYGTLIDEKILNSDKTKASVSLFIPEEKNAADYTAFVRERLTENGTEYTLTVDGLKEEDWADSWKQYYKPLKVGKRTVVVPVWEKYDAAPDEVIVRMDPGMAFGTGTHETTRLCIELMEKYLKNGDSVLDVGTGSGILAITAAKLGAGKIFACDLDPVAVRVAKDNFKENGVPQIECKESDLVKNVEGVYDLVSANIVAEIIVRMAPDVGKFMKDGAIIILSGIVETGADMVREAMTANGFAELETIKENDWNGMAFVKK